jgi:hypothetical protein
MVKITLTHPVVPAERLPSLRVERGKASKMRRGES